MNSRKRLVRMGSIRIAYILKIKTITISVT